jgi:hypothetical protein
MENAFKHRLDARGMSGLFPESNQNSKNKAAAFIGRFQSVDVFGTLMVPYSGANGDYDVVTRSIKNAYRSFVEENGWTVEKFFRAVVFALENKLEINKYTLGRAGRQYDMSKLPMGVLNFMDADEYDYVIGVKDESEL